MDALRYLITFSDGGSGMRERTAPLEVGDMIDDCGERYRITGLERHRQRPASGGAGPRETRQIKARGGPQRGKNPQPTRRVSSSSVRFSPIPAERSGGTAAKRRSRQRPPRPSQGPVAAVEPPPSEAGFRRAWAD